MQAIIKLYLSSIFTLHEVKPSSHVADEFQTKTSHHAEELNKTNQSDAIKVRPKEVYNLYNTFMQGFEVSAIIFCLGGQIIPPMEIKNKYQNLPLHCTGSTFAQPLHPRHLGWVCTSAPCVLSAPDNNLFPIIIGVKFAS